MKKWLKELRPEQWLKNGFVFAPLIFSQRWSDQHSLILSIAAALAFSLAASMTYIVNDILDRKEDREHPSKCHRPIAAGLISPAAGLTAAFLLLAGASGLAMLLGWSFALVLGSYLILTILYSLFLKRRVFVDVLVLAAGFVLRVVGGAAAIDVAVSRWILLCAFLLALYLALGKRRSELVLLGEGAGEHRAVLGQYSLPLVDQSISVVLGATVVSYALYTVAPDTVAKVGSEGLMVTVPLVMYGLFRYLYLLHKQELGGNPTRALLVDRPLFLCVILWLVSAAAVMTFGHWIH